MLSFISRRFGIWTCLMHISTYIWFWTNFPKSRNRLNIPCLAEILDRWTPIVITTKDNKTPKLKVILTNKIKIKYNTLYAFKLLCWKIVENEWKYIICLSGPVKITIIETIAVYKK